MKPTERYCFCLFHSHNPKPKRNHQIASSRAKTRSRQSHTCVKYRGNIICELKWSEKTSQKRLNQVYFLDIIFNFAKLSFGLLQPNAWLESYDHYGLFGTMIWGSLIVLWFFIFMQYSFCNSFRHCLLPCPWQKWWQYPTPQTGQLNGQRAVCGVRCAVCSLQYTVWSVKCEVCSLQWRVCSVQCAVWSPI